MPPKRANTSTDASPRKRRRVSQKSYHGRRTLDPNVQPRQARSRAQLPDATPLVALAMPERSPKPCPVHPDPPTPVVFVPPVGPAKPHLNPIETNVNQQKHSAAVKNPISAVSPTTKTLPRHCSKKRTLDEITGSDCPTDDSSSKKQKPNSPEVIPNPAVLPAPEAVAPTITVPIIEVTVEAASADFAAAGEVSSDDSLFGGAAYSSDPLVDFSVLSRLGSVSSSSSQASSSKNPNPINIVVQKVLDYEETTPKAIPVQAWQLTWPGTPVGRAPVPAHDVENDADISECDPEDNEARQMVGRKAAVTYTFGGGEKFPYKILITVSKEDVETKDQESNPKVSAEKIYCLALGATQLVLERYFELPNQLQFQVG
ncbi:hypothetical protein QBC35DRAFT_539274 [Podospora australis]|uniref:Uncharacterized protein n=1 Tax=Podospora australis TaxID=1536484 RepID=A0AAN6WMU6_9PEZI|nr:hypothetical protein QBC35DRAFT_539274 [Podospora australis]